MITVKFSQCHRLSVSRKGAFERLEPDDVKVSSPVLRGRGAGNSPLLPDADPLGKKIEID